MYITLGEIAKIAGGRLLQGNPDVGVKGIAIDSRKQVSGFLFCAIPGDRVDGHNFVNAVSSKGALGALVQREISVSDPAFGLVLVDSTIDALASLAAFHKRRVKAAVVGITGSVGKTSTKDLAAGVLSQKFVTYKNPGNLNSHIGLPLAIFGITPHHQYAVLEMAMRGKGEIKHLCGLAEPKIGILTDISASHIGVLGSLEEIAKAKLELLEYLPEDGLAILCWDNERIRKGRFHARCKTVTYGFREDADCKAHNVRVLTGGYTRFDVSYAGKVFGFQRNLPGYHQIQNALGAISLGFELGLTPEQINKGLFEASMTPMRLEIVDAGAFVIINDAYNASVKSMTSALDLLSQITKKRKIAVLGDILEMGDYGPRAHLEVGRYAREKADVLVAIGQLSRYTKQGWDESETVDTGSASWFPDKESAAVFLKQILEPGDTYLVKASRSLEFEQLVEFLVSLDIDSTGAEQV